MSNDPSHDSKNDPSSDPSPPASDEADPTHQTTPAGQVGELDDMIEETGAEVDPDEDDA